jgi:hypothetical protein
MLTSPAPSEGNSTLPSLPTQVSWWREAGFSTIPIATDGTKKPLGPWKLYQTAMPTDQDVQRWWGNGHYSGIAVICGQISGNVEMLELESRATDSSSLDKVRHQCQIFDAIDTWDLLNSTEAYSEMSPTGGIHLFYRIADHDVPGNTKVARRPATPEELAENPQDTVKVMSETRGDGGYVIVAPTRGICHPSGESWEKLTGSYGDVPTISWAQRNALHAAIREALDEMPPEPTRLLPVTPVTPQGPSVGLRPGDDWAARTDLGELLSGHGWEFSHRQGVEEYWTRPGKSVKDGHSASWNYKGTGLFYVFSTAVEGFESDKSYSKFNVLAILEYGGDMAAAARDLASKGYGASMEKTRDFSDFVPEAETVEETISRFDALMGAILDTDTLDSIPDPEPLIGPHILFTDSVNWMVGKPGCMKSFTALDMAGCVGTGETWQGYPTSKGHVLYLIAEGVRGTKKRVRAWETAMGRRMTGVSFLPVAVQASNGPQWAALVEVVKRLQPALVVLDTQARVTVGMEENSNTEMGKFADQAEKLRAASGCAVLIVHHIGRAGETGRGASAMDGILSTIIKVSKDEDMITLECQKNKDGEEWDDIVLRAVSTEDSITLSLTDGFRISGTLSSAALRVAQKWSEAHATDWVSNSALVDVVAPKVSLWRHQRELVQAGLVEKDETGRYPKFRLVSTTYISNQGE